MFVLLVFIGISENRKTNEYNIVLREKDGDRKILLNITSDLVTNIKKILADDNYNGIFDVFLTLIGKFGFNLKKTVIDVKNGNSIISMFDDYGASFTITTSLIDGIILSTYNASSIFIDENMLKKYRNIGNSIIYSSFDLEKYTLGDLYNMLDRARYDDSFLEEAVRIREEIKIREKKNDSPYKNGPDLIYLHRIFLFLYLQYFLVLCSIIYCFIKIFRCLNL